MFNRLFWKFNWKKVCSLHPLAVCSVTFLLVLMSFSITVPLGMRSAAVLGQLPILPTQSGTSSPPVGVERRGALESAGIRLDGKELFRIAAPAVLNRSDPGSQTPVEVRAKQIESNLEQVVTGQGFSDDEGLDPNTLRVFTEAINGLPVLFVKDSALAESRVLLTVTDADAQYAGISQARLAERWQEILERELRQAIALRQPKAFQQQVRTVTKVLIATSLLSLVLGGTWRYLGRRKHRLEQQHAIEMSLRQSQELSLEEPAKAESQPRLSQGLQHYHGLQRRLQIARFLRWLVFWSIVLIWVMGLSYSLNTFPQTRQFAGKIVVIPIVILIAWFLTGLTNRLTDLLIDRFIQNREEDQSLTEANLQRISTIARVIKGLKMVLVYMIAVLWVLQWLNLVPQSVLTLGALIALALSFAAQSLVKDFVNGFLILLEDQFRIGDNVRINTTTGMVENLNLRVTQLRTDDGSLITFPNSQILEVENRSRTWARANCLVAVAYNTDVDQALAVVQATAEQMAHDPEWGELILDTHELLGVDDISHTGIAIRVWIRTLPLKQWVTAREFRRRLKIAFDQHNIQIGIPQHILLKNGAEISDSIEQFVIESPE